MPYCNINDVNSYVPQQPFTATTTPTQAQVERYIADVANEMDLMFDNLGYVVPVVSGTRALIALRKVNAWGALGIAQASRITAVSPDQAVSKNVWTKMYEEWLDDLGNPRKPLELDAPKNAKEIVKPVGEMQSDTTLLTDQTFDYLTNPPFTMDQKL